MLFILFYNFILTVSSLPFVVYHFVLSRTTLSQIETSKLPMRQLTMCKGGCPFDFISKLPMRQLTGAVFAIILILLDLHQFSSSNPKFDTLVKTHD